MSGIPGIARRFGISRGWKLPEALRRRPAVSDTDELNMALAGAQMGLERKRHRWLLFLIEKEERLSARIANTSQEPADEPVSLEVEEA